jgi:hypothetical protein
VVERVLKKRQVMAKVNIAMRTLIGTSATFAAD